MESSRFQIGRHRETLEGITAKVLKGAKLQDLPIEDDVKVYMFDPRALWHWGLKRSNLPPGSIVLNRLPGFWQQYWRSVVGGIFILMAQTAAILALLWQRSRRRKIEAELRESEQRFRLVANTAPVMIWMSGTDKLFQYFNQPWFEFTGRSLEAESGNGWMDGVHAEDMKACLETYNRAFNQRESFSMQFRLRRHDGQYRWVFDLGVPRFNTDGSFAGYIGSCMDVTERKKAEEALDNLTGRLIAAQEEECKRIAREIHDDFNQRLAMVAIDLEELSANIKDAPAEDASQRLHQLFNSVSELGSDLHSLSHTLHSSTLENLGLVVGLKTMCKEFAEQQEIHVDFSHQNIPRDTPGDLALCLFRVAQEGLRNVKRHSGACRAEVRVEGVGGKLHLSVTDHGRGIDPNKPAAQRGIGIRSMEERLRLLGGHLEVHSRPMEGTRIDAWVPLTVARAA
jgi:PAS domain S-box-containing protein